MSFRCDALRCAVLCWDSVRMLQWGRGHGWAGLQRGISSHKMLGVTLAGL